MLIKINNQLKKNYKMSKININSELVNLFKEIDKKEEENKNDEGTKYKKVNKLIKDFMDKKNKNLNSESNFVVKDIIESLQIINIAYGNNFNNARFNKILLQKKEMTNKYIEQYHKMKKEEKKSDNKFEGENDDDDELWKKFEIIDIASPVLNEVIEKAIIIQKLLSANKIKQENDKIHELYDNISNIITEANKLIDNKALIDDEAIKRLNEQINAIKKEYEKIDKKKKNMEDHLKKYEEIMQLNKNKK